jgi:hypothetical protein
MKKAVMRIVYLGYYFKELDWEKYRHFIRHVNKETNISEAALVWKSILNSLAYNISLLEYFQFHFYRKTKGEKEKWDICTSFSGL